MDNGRHLIVSSRSVHLAADRRATATSAAHPARRPVIIGATVLTIGVAALWAIDPGRPGSTPNTSGGAVAAAAPVVTAASPAATASETAIVDLDGSAFTVGEGCTLNVKELVLNDTGTDVACLQTALAARGLYASPTDGVFDLDVLTAVKALQTEEDLVVDGVVGNQTAGLLGIRKPKELRVVRTPTPPPETLDSTGYYLSSVASKGRDAPALPENSGDGRRVVYDRLGQRVWAVGEDGGIIRSWLVSGSKFDNEVAGTFRVYSRSREALAWNEQAKLPYMIRYYQTDIGHIGFHGIPLSAETGERYQTDDELGTPLSGGCQRQADLDAAFMWAFAGEGTKVVVI